MSLCLSIEEIESLLPHRYPFLMVDRITDLMPGKEGIGIKSVSVNEPFFQGHFSSERVMPGVLIVEACSQVAGLVKISENFFNIKEHAPKIDYLASILRFHFKNKVVPGDQLIMRAFDFKVVQNLTQVNVQAMVKNKLVAEGVLVVTSS